MVFPGAVQYLPCLRHEADGIAPGGQKSGEGARFVGVLKRGPAVFILEVGCRLTRHQLEGGVDLGVEAAGGGDVEEEPKAEQYQRQHEGVPDGKA